MVMRSLIVDGRTTAVSLRGGRRLDVGSTRREHVRGVSVDGLGAARGYGSQAEGAAVDAESVGRRGLRAYRGRPGA